LELFVEYNNKTVDFSLNMVPNCSKEEDTFMVNKNDSVDTEFSPQLDSVTDSNESNIQPGIYILIEYRYLNAL
jgi:hypothetical protein